MNSGTDSRFTQCCGHKISVYVMAGNVSVAECPQCGECVTGAGAGIDTLIERWNGGERDRPTLVSMNDMQAFCDAVADEVKAEYPGVDYLRFNIESAIQTHAKRLGWAWYDGPKRVKKASVQ